MFRRMFWFLTGAVAGVWATAKVNRAVRRMSPDSLAATAADRALETGARLRLFARDVRVGMAQREDELHDALGLRGRIPEPVEAGPADAGPSGAGPADRGSRTRKARLGLPVQGTDLPAERRGIAYHAHEDRKDEH